MVQRTQAGDGSWGGPSPSLSSDDSVPHGPHNGLHRR